MIDELIRVWILYNKIEAWTFRGHKHGKRENDIRCVLSRKSFSVWTHVAHESNVSLASYKVSLCSMRKHLAFNYKYIFSRTLCNRILNWVVHSFSFLFSLPLSLSLFFLRWSNNNSVMFEHVGAWKINMFQVSLTRGSGCVFSFSSVAPRPRNWNVIDV